MAAGDLDRRIKKKLPGMDYEREVNKRRKTARKEQTFRKRRRKRRKSRRRGRDEP